MDRLTVEVAGGTFGYQGADERSGGGEAREGDSLSRLVARIAGATAAL